MKCTLCGYEGMFCTCHDDSEVVTALRARLAEAEGEVDEKGKDIEHIAKKLKVERDYSAGLTADLSSALSTIEAVRKWHATMHLSPRHIKQVSFSEMADLAAILSTAPRSASEETLERVRRWYQDAMGESTYEPDWEHLRAILDGAAR